MEFIGTDLIAAMAMSLLVGFGGAVIWSTILVLTKIPKKVDFRKDHPKPDQKHNYIILV